MDIEEIECARQMLLMEIPGVSTVGQLWRVHAAAHLAERLDTELRGGVKRWAGEDAAIAVVKGAARDLDAAARALMDAAGTLRGNGLGYQANRTYHAAQAAAKAAQALDPQ